MRQAGDALDVRLLFTNAATPAPARACLASGKNYDRCRAPSTTPEITATILEKAGISAPSEMESRSLRPILEGKADRTRDHVISGLGSWRMVIRDRHKFIRGFDKGPLLFGMVNDPAENENLVRKMPELAERMGRILDAECGVIELEKGRR